MTSPLMAMLSQQMPNLPMRKGLVLTGLQHDFISPDGKLPVSNLDSGFLDRTKALIDEFRGHGDIVWIRTEIGGSKSSRDLDEDACNVITSLTQHDQTGSDDSSDDASESDSGEPTKKRKPGYGKSSSVDTASSSRRKQQRASISDDATTQDAAATIDEEHFLRRTPNREACFIKGSVGAGFAKDVESSVQPTDLHVVKGYYSAFKSTSLLPTLRSKLITELYICGAMTNLNVYATSMDAARHGIKITLVENCLGYRQKERHDLAIKNLVNIMDASVMTSDEVITAIGGRASAQARNKQPVNNYSAQEADAHAVSDALEAASSDEDDDEDLLSVRASPSKSSNRPLEIRGGRPETKHLQADTGSEDRTATQHSQLAPAESIAGSGGSQRKDADAGERSREGQAVQLEGALPASQSGVVSASRPRTPKDRKLSPQSVQRATAGRSGDPVAISSKVPRDRSNSQQRTSAAKSRRRNRKTDVSSTIDRQASQPLFGVGKEEDSTSSSIQYDLLPPDRIDGLFHRLKEEVTWQKMHHQTGEVPRLVCCQGTIDAEGNMPIYRHPSDETLPLHPWTSAVNEIREAAEAACGHILNHALIQLYRAGTDFISEHSDKTLDIVPDSHIVNASFGAERVMRLRTKRAAPPPPPSPPTSTSQNTAPKPRTTHRVRLPHNSALIMSLQTNAQYLHSINADKRPAIELSAAEKAYEGQRISLTFRRIGTFLDAESERIWGLGAKGKYKEDANGVLGGEGEETERLLKGFGRENAGSEVRWEEWYGEGSDVLHLK